MNHQASMKLGLDKAMLCHAKEDESGSSNDRKSNGSGSSRKGSGSSKKGSFALLSAAADSSKFDLKADEIDHLLKKGAYDVFRDDDQEAKDFVAADLDAIMARAAHKVSVVYFSIRCSIVYCSSVVLLLFDCACRSALSTTNAASILPPLLLQVLVCDSECVVALLLIALL
jgi:hypothetical protein